MRSSWLHCSLAFLFCLSFQCHAANNLNIYQYTQPGLFSETAKRGLPRVYVPNGGSGTVSVIDPLTYQVIATHKTGQRPQHVVPSYDMQTLWVLNNKSNTLTPIDAFTAQPKPSITVDDPYNLYFTMDGKYAIVVCEAKQSLEFRDPQSMQLLFKIPVTCRGANHMDFSPDGRYAIATCEFSGQLVKIDLVTHQVVAYLALKIGNFERVGQRIALVTNNKLRKKTLPLHSMPQDIRSTADGQLFLVADMMQDGVILIDPHRFIQIGFIPTEMGTHGIYPSRDGRLFYVSNRGCHHISCQPHGPGSISVVDPALRKVVAHWDIPNGGSPDMGNVSADGKELWLTGRYDHEVYVFDTSTGVLTHRIPVGRYPHGLAVWPLPGRFSLGHTGNMR